MDLRTGMLWFDDARDRSLTEKIARAVAYYQAKYGQAPNTCYVPPSASADDATISGVRVKSAPNILPGHLWLGVA
jgi:hypothetical protein